MFRWFSTLPRNHYDVVIGGGGIIGCSSAYFLSQRMPPEKICVIERDPTYKMASSVLSVGSIRQQFSLKGNILLSLRSAKFLKDVSNHLSIDGEDKPDVQFVEGGYLFLATERGKDNLRRNHKEQMKAGANIKLMSPFELEHVYPWLNTDGLALGSLGMENEGWFDPYLLLSAFKQKIISLGVQYVHGDIDGLKIDNQLVRKVEILHNSKSYSLECNHFVNAGGPQAAKIALMAGVGSSTHPDPLLRIGLPVRPRRRNVFVLHCPNGPANMPMLIDPSGFYVRKETQKNTYICGISPEEDQDPDADDLEVDYWMFDEIIWPLLAHRVPAFEAVKVQSAWAGFYDYNTFDQNGIVGTHPSIRNLVFANGFSGHGIQQSPEVGKAVSEIIVDGSPSLLELKEFGFERLINQRPLRESNVV